MVLSCWVTVPLPGQNSIGEALLCYKGPRSCARHSLLKPRGNGGISRKKQCEKARVPWISSGVLQFQQILWHIWLEMVAENWLALVSGGIVFSFYKHEDIHSLSRLPTPPLDTSFPYTPCNSPLSLISVNIHGHSNLENFSVYHRLVKSVWNALPLSVIVSLMCFKRICRYLYSLGSQTRSQRD